MNPVFFILVLLALVVIWFLLAFSFKPIGSFFYKIWKDAVEEIKEEEETKDER